MTHIYCDTCKHGLIHKVVYLLRWGGLRWVFCSDECAQGFYATFVQLKIGGS